MVISITVPSISSNLPTVPHLPESKDNLQLEIDHYMMNMELSATVLLVIPDFSLNLFLYFPLSLKCLQSKSNPYFCYAPEPCNKFTG